MPNRVIGQETVDITNYFCDGCNVQFQNLAKNIETAKEGSLVMNFDFGWLSKRDGERYDYCFCQDCSETILSYIKMFKELKNTQEEDNG